MNRRTFLGALTPAIWRTADSPALKLPLYRVFDSRLHDERHLHHFRSTVWSEAVRDFARGGIALEATDGPGEVKFTAADRPILNGLRRGTLNIMITGTVPMFWDAGRSVAGLTTIYEGYHVCVIAARYAHGDQAPYLSVNTCVHEMLHALMLDVFRKPPSWYQAGGRDFRIDWYATRMWLFHEGAAVQASARTYLERLRASAPALR